MRRSIFWWLVMLALASAAVAAPRRAPDWLDRAVAAPVVVPTDGDDYVVLVDDSLVEVAKDGLFTVRTRYAIRVLTADGRRSAVATVGYFQGTDKVTSFRAWVVPQKGAVVELGKREIVDVAAHSSALEIVTEMRQQILRPPTGSINAGDVFGFESVVQERSVFAQRTWWFQGSAPVERSSLTITLPPGWDVQAAVFNTEALSPIRHGASVSWTLEHLRAPASEPFSPSLGTLVPWMGIDIRPPAAEAGRLRQLGNMSWPQLSQHFSPHYDAAAATNADMQARVATLTAGKSTPWDKIITLGRFVQQVNYISINLNAARAGGFIPRPAADVFRLNYGDCKDKATLLRALLATQGIVSYPLVVYSGDRDHVRPEWSSPLQFNHCVLAIAVDDAVDSAAVVQHPELGRLLVFDPTDEVTPPGFLQADELGRHALLLAGGKGGLVDVPDADAAVSHLERRVQGRLSSDGMVEGTIEEVFSGLAARAVRREYRDRSTADYKRLIERWLARSLPTPTARQVEVTDDADVARFSLAIDFFSPSYGKPMRDVLLVFKPVLVARREQPVLRKTERLRPVQLSRQSFSEQSTLRLPEGFRVDELPPPVQLETPFGSYRATTRVEAGVLQLERSLTVRRVTLPPSEAGSVRTFFESVLRAEQTPVVLERM